MLFAIFCVLAFLAAGTADFLETRYVRAVGSGDSTKAALCSVAMLLVSAVGLVAVVEISTWMLVPEALGMFIGTKLAMR